MKKIFIILIIILIAIIIFALGGDSDEQNKISILQEFKDKIVYTVDISSDKIPFENDCEVRSGDFNECGTVCSSSSDMCAAVCAYTFEL